MRVEFDSDKDYPQSPATRTRQSKSGIGNLLIKLGVAQNKKQAELIMIGLIVILCIISFFAIRSMRDAPASVEPPLEFSPDGTPIP